MLKLICHVHKLKNIIKLIRFEELSPDNEQKTMNEIWLQFVSAYLTQPVLSYKNDRFSGDHILRSNQHCTFSHSCTSYNIVFEV